MKSEQIKGVNPEAFIEANADMTDENGIINEVLAALKEVS